MSKIKLIDLIKQDDRKDSLNMYDLTFAGLHQQKYVHKTIWKYAMLLMQRAEELGYTQPYDFGRGKGKWITTDRNISTKQLSKKLESDSKSKQILDKVNKWYIKLISKK